MKTRFVGLALMSLTLALPAFGVQLVRGLHPVWAGGQHRVQPGTCLVGLSYAS